MAEVTSFVVSVAGGTFFDIPIGSGDGAAIQPGHTLEIAAQWANNGSPSPSFSYTGGTPTTPPTNRVAWSSPGSGSVSSGVWTWVVEPGITNIRMTFSPSDDGNAIVTAFEDVTAIKVPGSPPAWAGAAATTATSPTIASVEAGAIVHAGVDIASGSEPVSIVTAGGTVVGEGPERKGFVARFSQVTTGTVSGKQFSWPTAGAYRPRAWAIAYEFPPPDPPIEATLMTEPYPGASGDVADGITIIPNLVAPVPSIVGTATGGRVGDGSFNVTPPAGADYWIALVAAGHEEVTAPSGWTLVKSWAEDGTSPTSDPGYWLFESTGSPGSSWSYAPSSATSPVAVLVRGYTGVTGTALMDQHSATSPAATATDEARCVRAVFDLNDSTSPLGYPTAATLNRAQQVQPHQSEGWSASVGIAEQEVSAGSVGTAAWTVPDAYEPHALTLILYGGNPGLAVAIGTNKSTGSDGGLYVFDMDGEILSSQTGFTANSVDWRDTTGLSGWDGRILVMTCDRTSGDFALVFFWFDRTTRTLTSAGTIPVLNEPYGTCLGINGGVLYAYMTERGPDDVSPREFYQASLVRSGDTVTLGSIVRQFTIPSVVEGMAVSDADNALIMSQEDVGLFALGAGPAGGDWDDRLTIDLVGSGNLVADVEDVAIVYTPDGPRVLVSSQGDNSYHVYSWDEIAEEYVHEMRFTVVRPDGTTQVTGTDGLDALHVNLGTNFPNGLIAVHDDGSDPSVFAFIDAAEVFGPLATPEGGFEATYLFGPAAASGVQDATGGFATAYAFGPADASSDTEHRGGFEGTYLFGPAEAEGEAPAGGVFETAYAFGEADASGEATYSGGFEATYSFGPAEAEGHVDVEGGFEAAWAWGPADAGGSSPTGGGFSAAYEFGPADAGGEADYSGEFAAAYEFGPASATGGGSAVGGFTTTWAWGPADAGGAAEPEGDFEAAYAFGPAEASGESAGGGGFAATYGWGIASAGGEADYSGGFTTTYLFGPAGFAGSTTAEPCWPTMFLVPDGPSTTLIPEGPVMNLVEDGCRP